MLRVCKTYFFGCIFSGRIMKLGNYTSIWRSTIRHKSLWWLFVALWAELNTHDEMNDWPRCRCHLGRIYRKSHRFCIQSAHEILHRQDTFGVPSPIFSVSARRRAPMQGIITVSARWGELNGFRLFEAMSCFFHCLPWSDGWAEDNDFFSLPLGKDMKGIFMEC